MQQSVQAFWILVVGVNFLIWPIQGCAAGQGTVFYLSILNRVYNFV